MLKKYNKLSTFIFLKEELKIGFKLDKQYK